MTGRAWRQPRRAWTGLAAISLAVAFVGLGASAASAASTSLCSTPSCGLPDAYPAKTPLSASLQKGTAFKLLSSVGTIECEKSSIAGKTTAEAGEPLPLEIAQLTFEGNCHLGSTKCTSTTTALPTSPSLKATGEGDGTLSLEGAEVNFKCGFLINCTYWLTPTLQFEGGNPASFGATELALSKFEGFCPQVSKLDVSYTLTEPVPAFAVET